MTATTQADVDQTSAQRNRTILVVYTAAIFVSALLLFSVQPLFTKMVLPRLGGSPAVWSVAMVFFQSLLLGGYAYAHYLSRIRSRAVPIGKVPANSGRPSMHSATGECTPPSPRTKSIQHTRQGNTAREQQQGQQHTHITMTGPKRRSYLHPSNSHLATM